MQAPSISSSRCLIAHRHKNHIQAATQSIAGTCCCDELSTHPAAESLLHTDIKKNVMFAIFEERQADTYTENLKQTKLWFVLHFKISSVKCIKYSIKLYQTLTSNTNV